MTEASQPKPAPRSTSLLFSTQGRLFAAHVAILVSAAVWLQPLNRAWSARAWVILMQVCALSSAYKVYIQYGLPQIRPFSGALARVKAWLQPAGNSSNFHYTLLAGLFVGNARPTALAALPFVVLAAYHASAFAAQNLGHLSLWQRYGRRAHQYLASNQQQALLLNAGAEVALGFLSVLQLIAPPRNILLPIMVWQILRMRYWSPDAASYHRQVWEMVGQRAAPVLRMLPLLNTAVGWAQKWWMSAAPVPQRPQ